MGRKYLLLVVSVLISIFMDECLRAHMLLLLYLQDVEFRYL